MINKVILLGRIANVPKIHHGKDGKLTICAFSLAVERGYKSRDDSGRNACDFLLCKAFNKTAQNIDSYCRKGSLVCVTGQVHSSKFTNKEKKQVYVTEIVVENIKFLPNFGQIQTESYFPHSPDEMWHELSEAEKQHFMMKYREEGLKEYQERQVRENVTTASDNHSKSDHPEEKWKQLLNHPPNGDQLEKEAGEIANAIKERASDIIDSTLKHGPASKMNQTEENSADDQSPSEMQNNVSNSHSDEDTITDSNIPF